MKLYLILALGVACISTAAVIIRMIEAPAISIVLYRMGIASLFLLPITIAKRKTQVLHLSFQDICLCTISGVALALHFGSWITSLGYTSIASSVILVTTSPLLVAILSRIYFHESINRNVCFGLMFGLTGAFILTIGDRYVGKQEFYGDVLAMIGALSFAIYLMIGRKLRQHISNLNYVTIVCLVASTILLLTSILTNTQMLGFNYHTLWLLLILAIIAQLIGHSSITWALGKINATLVSIAIMAEPIGATMLAWFVLNEPPSWTNSLGGILIFAGIFLAFRNTNQRSHIPR